VEKTLYRIPPSNLTKVSPVFRDMLEAPSGSEASEGSGDNTPIFLESITQIDWERLLKVILHKSYLDPPLKFNLDEWISVLKLSTLWKMDVVRATAIKSIEEFDDPARKIHVAREYGISSYYPPALSQLVLRPRSLSVQDIGFLGLECGLKIISIRE
ncbi:hypothetical protein BDP27DRAFT_1170502, partial [Rhodocollybia butyracea]